jgi:phosphoribosylformimino-5-aminoimidazole carboxamide ribotide isomerase
MRIIPSIDLLDGKVVRLQKGSYDAVTVYDESPEGLAGSWRQQVDLMHVVDLEGARAGEPVQCERIREVVEAFGPGVQVGGGVRSREAIEAYFDLGVARVVLGTAAIRAPELLEQAAVAHPGQIVLAVDARAGWVAIAGWREQSQIGSVDLVQRFAALPLAAVLYTDIERDGTQVGPNVAETARLAEQGGLPVIASGGVGSLEHVRQLARCVTPLAGVIIGRALHERTFSLAEAIVAGRRAVDAG